MDFSGRVNDVTFISAAEPGWTAKWHLSPGERIGLSVFPPRPYPWADSFSQTFSLTHTHVSPTAYEQFGGYVDCPDPLGVRGPEVGNELGTRARRHRPGPSPPASRSHTPSRHEGDPVHESVVLLQPRPGGVRERGATAARHLRARRGLLRWPARHGLDRRLRGDASEPRGAARRADRSASHIPSAFDGAEPRTPCHSQLCGCFVDGGTCVRSRPELGLPEVRFAVPKGQLRRSHAARPLALGLSRRQGPDDASLQRPRLGSVRSVGRVARGRHLR